MARLSKLFAAVVTVLLAVVVVGVLTIPPFGSMVASGVTQIAYNLVQNAGTPLARRSTINCTGAGITCSDSGGVTEFNVGAGGGGTVTSVATGCGLSGGTITTTGTVISSWVADARTTTSEAIADSDCGKQMTFSNGSAIAATIAQAGSGGNFINGWFTVVKNIGAGALTITPATSTISGAASITLSTGEFCVITSDGTNYEGDCNHTIAGTNMTITKTRTGQTFDASGGGGSGNLSDSGTFYANNGTSNFGPIFPVTPPNTVSFSWRNQGTASETAVGNALYLLAVSDGTGNNNVRGREITLPSTPVSITSMLLTQGVQAQFPACGMYFADNGTGRLTLFAPTVVSGVLNWRVDHFTNATTISANVFSQGVLPSDSSVTIKLQDNGTNHVFFISSNGGQTFLQVFSESRTVWLATPDRVGYFCNAANATFNVGTTLISWVQGT